MALLDAPIHANEAAYERVVRRAPLPVVAVFWRRDCPPCEKLDPLLNQLAREHAGRLLVVKLNVEDAPEAAKREGIQRVPTLLLVKDGEVLARGEGTPPENVLRRWVTYLVGEHSHRPEHLPTGPAVPLDGTEAMRQPHVPSTDRSLARPVPVTDATFADFVRSGVALVDFWADWCGPCHMIAPAVDALAREYAGRVRVGKLNVDQNPRTPARFGIQGIPTLIIFRDGRPVQRIVGVQSLPALRRYLDDVLAGIR
ncbi:MAG: thioredoxin [Ardenticatenia bacterium]|nr:thioredoxin [Ardenticatenia bacterium]